MMLLHRERGGGPADCRVGAAVWFKCLSGFRYWGHLRTSSSLSVEIVIRINEYHQSAGPDFKDGTMFYIFSSMYMNVCPRRPTVDSKARERSPTSPRESGAAVPLMESHNSKVNISPSDGQLIMKIG